MQLWGRKYGVVGGRVAQHGRSHLLRWYRFQIRQEANGTTCMSLDILDMVETKIHGISKSHEECIFLPPEDFKGDDLRRTTWQSTKWEASIVTLFNAFESLSDQLTGRAGSYICPSW